MTREKAKAALTRQIEALPEILRPHAQPLLKSVEGPSTDEWVVRNVITIIHALKFLENATTGAEAGSNVVQGADTPSSRFRQSARRTDGEPAPVVLLPFLLWPFRKTVRVQVAFVAPGLFGKVQP